MCIKIAQNKKTLVFTSTCEKGVNVWAQIRVYLISEYLVEHLTVFSLVGLSHSLSPNTLKTGPYLL